MCIEPHRQFGYASYARVYDRAKIRNVRHGVIRWKRNRVPRETNFMERLQPTPRKYRCGFLKLEVTRRGIFSRVRFSAMQRRSATGKHF